jgi:hypothetical protein
VWPILTFSTIIVQTVWYFFVFQFIISSLYVMLYIACIFCICSGFIFICSGFIFICSGFIFICSVYIFICSAFICICCAFVLIWKLIYILTKLLYLLFNIYVHDMQSYLIMWPSDGVSSCNVSAKRTLNLL